MKKAVIFAVGLIALACAGVTFAEGDVAAKAPAKADKPEQTVVKKATPIVRVHDGNLKVSFKIASGNTEGSGVLMIASGSTTNYVSGKESPVETADETGKKTVTGVNHVRYVANIQATTDPRMPSVAEVQAQFEMTISHPNGKGGMVQYQGVFRVEKGKSVVAMEDGDKRIEVTVEDAK